MEVNVHVQKTHESPNRNHRPSPKPKASSLNARPRLEIPQYALSFHPASGNVAASSRYGVNGDDVDVQVQELCSPSQGSRYRQCRQQGFVGLKPSCSQSQSQQQQRSQQRIRRLLYIYMQVRVDARSFLHKRGFIPVAGICILELDD
jgi:hypothetical protein